MAFVDMLLERGWAVFVKIKPRFATDEAIIFLQILLDFFFFPDFREGVDDNTLVSQAFNTNHEQKTQRV